LDEADSVPCYGREKAVHGNNGDNGNQKPSQFAAFARGSSEWKSQKAPAGMIDEHENSQVLPFRKGGRLTAINAAHCLSRYMTDRGRALKERYQWEARAQWRDEPVKGMCAGSRRLELLA